MKTYYFHSAMVKGEKRHTVAGVVEQGSLKLGIASCSTSDNFVKSKGREIAEGRAIEAPKWTIPFNKKSKNPGKSFTLIAQGLIVSLE